MNGMKILDRGLKAIVGLLFLYAFAVVFVNLITPGYRDHASPLVTVTSWISLFDAYPLYHRPDFHAVYNLMYGPWLYFFHWPAFIIFGGSFFASKFMGSLVYFGSLFLIFRLSQKFQSLNSRLLFLVYFIPFTLNVEDFFYGNRADSFLLFFSLLGCWTYFNERLSENTKLIVTAILMGICFNLKVHAVLYVAPFVGVLAFKSWRNFILASLIFLASVALPWLFIREQLPVYIEILRGLSKEMSLADEGKKVILHNFWTLFFFSLFWRFRFGNDNRMLKVLSVLAIIGSTILASKVGSGTNQLIPLLSAYFVFFHLAESREIQAKNVAWIFLGLAYLLISFGKGQMDMMTYFSKRSDLLARNEEIRSLIKDLPEKSLLFTYSTKNYDESTLRPEIFFQNKASMLIVDSVTMMENLHSNVPFPEQSRTKLTECYAGFALEEKQGEVYRLRSFYPPWDIVFDDQWQGDYKQHYSLKAEGNYYRLMACQK